MDFLPPIGCFGIQGSRALSYSDTPEDEGSAGKLKSMSAMPYYQSRSHEELRLEDIELQKRSSFLNQNQGNPFQQSSSLFGPNPSHVQGNTFQQSSSVFGPNPSHVQGNPFQQSSSIFGPNPSHVQGNPFQESSSLFGPNPSPVPSSWSVFGTTTAAKPPFSSTGSGVSPFFPPHVSPFFPPDVSPFFPPDSSTGNGFVHRDPRVCSFETSTTNVFSATKNSGSDSSTNAFGFPSATLPEGLSVSPLKFSSIPSFSIPYAPGFSNDIPSTSVPWSSLSFDGSSLSGTSNNRGPTTSGFCFFSASASGSSSTFGVQTSFAAQGSTATKFPGSQIASYSATDVVEENPQNPYNLEKIQSISALSSSKERSHEELRFEYYGLGDKGRSTLSGDPFFRSSGLLTSDTPSSKQSSGYSPFQPFKFTFSELERENLVTPSNLNSTAPTQPPFANPFSQTFTLQPPTNSSGLTLISKLNPPTLNPSPDPMVKNSCECSKTSTTSTTSSVGTFSFTEPSVIISPSIQSTPVISSDPWSCLVNNASQPQQSAEKVGSLSTNNLNISSKGKGDGAKDNSSSFQLNENSTRLTDDTATQILNWYEDEVSGTTERQEADVAALLPRLPDEEYYTEPSLHELAAKEMAEPGFCCQVKDFVVGRQGYGSIKFLGVTDVRHLDVESVVQFDNRQVMIYPDKRKKPQVGQNLNKAEVTLLNVKCIDKKTGKQYIEGRQIQNYEEKLIRKTQEQGMEFVSYDPVEGEWKFRVQLF